MRVKKILVPVIITSTVLIASCGSRQPVEEAMTQQTESETSITLFNASNGITPETTENDTLGTVEQETIPANMQEAINEANEVLSNIEVNTEPAEDIKIIDEAYVETTAPKPEQPTNSQQVESETSTQAPTSQTYNPSLFEESYIVQTDIAEADSVYNPTVEEFEVKYMYIINGGCIRKEPNTDSEIMHQFRSDEDTVLVIGKVNEGNWYKVRTMTEDGYVSGTFLTTNESVLIKDPSKVIKSDTPRDTNINPLTGEQWKPGDEAYIVDPDGSVIHHKDLGDSSDW